MPTLRDFDHTLVRELEETFNEIRKQQQALDANRKGMADISKQLLEGSHNYSELAYKGVCITNEIRQREAELEKLKERAGILKVKIPWTQLTHD